MNKLSLNKYFKNLLLFYMTLIFIQLVFILVSLHIRSKGYITDEYDTWNFLKYVVPILAIIALFTGKNSYKRIIVKARKKSTLAKKLASYRKAFMIQFMFWLAPSLVSILAYMLTGNWVYVTISGLIIILFIINRPGIEKARKELDF
jgi:uncharacterized membrane protein